MTDIQRWQITISIIALLVGLAGGGAMGALITWYATSRRGRIQPVGHKIDIVPVMKQKNDASLRTKVIVSRGDKEYTFKNLFLVNVEVVDKGNQDIQEFRFGITLGGADLIVHHDYQAPDRHHSIAYSLASPEEPKPELDYVLTPFNRQDIYSFKLYVVIPEGEDEPNLITLSSPHPIKFTSMPTWKELIVEKIEITNIGVGPVRLLIKR